MAQSYTKRVPIAGAAGRRACPAAATAPQATSAGAGPGRDRTGRSPTPALGRAGSDGIFAPADVPFDSSSSFTVR